MSGHTYQEYPKWKYHRKLGSKIVHNAEEEKALSDTWYDNPSESADTSQFSASHWPVRWPVSTLRSESFLAFRGQIRLKTSRQLREVKSIRLPTCKPNFDGHLYRKARPFSAVTAAKYVNHRRCTQSRRASAEDPGCAQKNDSTRSISLER